MKAVMPYISTLRKRCEVYSNYDWALADDLMQDTLLFALEHWPPAHYLNMGGWLCTICFNRAITVWRKRSREVPVEEIWDVKTTYSPEKHIEHAIPVRGLTGFMYWWTCDEICHALQIMNGEFSEAVMLYDIARYSCKEIAQVQNVPVGTVWSRVSRARESLRSAVMMKCT